MFFEYPTEQDWAKLENSYAFATLHQVESKLANSWPSDKSIESFTRSIQMHDWTMHLEHRLHFVRRSYVYLRFQYDKGIPDEEWFVSPGRAGQAVQYHPQFEQEHRWYKTQFDYYTDAFFWQVFSAWETLGHLLNIGYDMGIKQKNISFNTAHKKLEVKNPELHRQLKENILETQSYKQLSRLRNDITHNFLPGKVGGTMRVTQLDEKTTAALTVGDYITSTQMLEYIIKALDLFVETMRTVTQVNSQQWEPPRLVL